MSNSWNGSTIASNFSISGPDDEEEEDEEKSVEGKSSVSIEEWVEVVCHHRLSSSNGRLFIFILSFMDPDCEQLTILTISSMLARSKDLHDKSKVWGETVGRARKMDDLPMWLQYYPKTLFDTINRRQGLFLV